MNLHTVVLAVWLVLVLGGGCVSLAVIACDRAAAPPDRRGCRRRRQRRGAPTRQ